jgi:ArsR family transcriptional regulator
MHEQQLTAVFKALSDKTRLEIVKKLVASPCNGASCGEVRASSALSQPAMSHHFGKLADAGIVSERKDGKEKYYELNYELLEKYGIDPSKF